MTRFSHQLGRIAAFALIGCTLVLAGCHRGATKAEIASIEKSQHFDMTLQAYKSGQFLVDGAVLSALDTGSHFAYLKDAGKLPKTVLLTPSDDSKVRKNHLQFLARLQLDYGFTAYYDDGGTLKKINAVETGTRALEDYHGPRKMDDNLKGKDAASGGFDPQHQ